MLSPLFGGLPVCFPVSFWFWCLEGCSGKLSAEGFRFRIAGPGGSKLREHNERLNDIRTVEGKLLPTR